MAVGPDWVWRLWREEQLTDIVIIHGGTSMGGRRRRRRKKTVRGN